MFDHWIWPLLAVTLLATAGCLAPTGGPPDGRTSTETAPPSTGTSTSSPPAEPVTPSGSPTPVETPAYETVSFDQGPKAEPDRPDELTESTVPTYVRTYEYRYVYNLLWYNEHSEVELDCETDAVEETDDGYRAIVTCSGYSNTGGDPDGNATSTAVHADWFTQTYVYRVTGDATERRDATEEEHERYI